MTIQEFKNLYFKKQLTIYNDYQQENCLDDYIYDNDADTINEVYGGNLDLILRDLSNCDYNYFNDYFILTSSGLETIERSRAEEIINEATEDILFKNYLEDYDY